jgi:hypothetical protein
MPEIVFGHILSPPIKEHNLLHFGGTSIAGVFVIIRLVARRVQAIVLVKVKR